MAIFFEVIKGVFFLMSVVIGLFTINGGQILEVIGFDGQNYELVKTVMMPGYLILCGLMMGYIIAHLRLINHDEDEQFDAHSIYVKSFIIGIVIGVVLALVSVFL